MKFSKFSKTISTITSLCCLCAGGINAILSQEILDARTSLKKMKPCGTEKSNLIGSGSQGQIYNHPRDDKKVIKLINNFKNTDDDTINELDIAVLLTKNDIPPSLMKVYDVGLHNDGKQTNGWYICEKISGQTVQSDSTRIDWKCFCKQWVKGLLEGMDYLRQKLGHTKRKDENGKEKECFILLGDRNQKNIIVKSDGTPKHIDMGVVEYIDVETGRRIGNQGQTRTSTCISNVCSWLLRKLNNVDIPDESKEQSKILKNYLSKHKDPKTVVEENTLATIIADVTRIIDGV